MKDTTIINDEKLISTTEYKYSIFSGAISAITIGSVALLLFFLYIQLI